MGKEVHSDKGRIVFRGDIVKDEDGAFAVFTEQGASASNMAAAKMLERACSTWKSVSGHQEAPRQDIKSSTQKIVSPGTRCVDATAPAGNKGKTYMFSPR